MAAARRRRNGGTMGVTGEVREVRDARMEIARDLARLRVMGTGTRAAFKETESLERGGTRYGELFAAVERLRECVRQTEEALVAEAVHIGESAEKAQG